MKNADDSRHSKNIIPDETDLGPEPDWLLDDDLDEAPEPARPTGESASEQSKPRPQAQTVPVGPDPKETAPESKVAVPASGPETRHTIAAPAERKDHPWMWGIIPLVLLLATGLIAWFGSTQTLNGLGTWEAIRSQQPPLLPARWAMLTWWAVFPLLAMFLVYSALPAGRLVTRIKLAGPLLSASLVAASLWIFSQHWQWDVVGLVSIGLATVAIIATYLLVVMGPNIKNVRQRFLSVAPLSAALGYSVMLTVLTWQGYSAQPFGERGSSAIFALLLVMIAAIFAFFLRDGLFALVLAIWFAGVVHQQWGEDALVSLVAAVAVLLTAALAGLGTILATESHRPSLTASIEKRRGRISFFKKRDESPPE